MWTKDTKTDGPLPEGKLPVFQFQANVVHDLNYCGRRVLTGAAVDGRVAQRLEVDLQCDCGLSSPDREHFTFFCEADPWHGDLKTPTERRVACSSCGCSSCSSFWRYDGRPHSGGFSTAVWSTSNADFGFGWKLCNCSRVRTLAACQLGRGGSARAHGQWVGAWFRANSCCGRERCTSSSLLGFTWSEQSGALADWQPSSCATSSSWHAAWSVGWRSFFHTGIISGCFWLMALLVLGFPRMIKFLDGVHPKGGLMFCVAACSMPKRMLARLI